MRLLLPTVTVYRILTYKTSSTPPLCVEVSVPNQESERFYELSVLNLHSFSS
jgi:hypothetical protein